MNPARPTDIDASLLAEYRSLQRQLESKHAEFESLKKALETEQKPRRNKRYSVEFAISPDQPLNTEHISTFVVDKGTRFHCMQIEDTTRMQGDDADNDAILLSLPKSQLFGVFDYDFRVFDTGSDREWFNVTKPETQDFVGMSNANGTTGYVTSQVLMSGLLSGLQLPRCAILAGGTEVVVGIKPLLAATTIYARGPYPNPNTLFSSVSEYILQLSFVGFEEPL